jgi:hypothetical protein
VLLQLVDHLSGSVVVVQHRLAGAALLQ